MFLTYHPLPRIMKKLLVLCFLMPGLISSLRASEGFTIKGTIHGNYTGYIYLSYENVKDSALVQNNTFELKGQVKKAVIGSLHLKPFANVVWIFLENSEIRVEANFSTAIERNENINLLNELKITGSYSQKLLDEYRAFCKVNRTQENFNALRFQRLKLMFAQNSTQPLSGWILGDLAVSNPIYTYQEFIELYSLLDTAAMQRSDVELIKTGLRTMNTYGIGQPFPTFELVNQYNKVINSTTYSGKIVLVDFWASWCAPCRAKHPALIDLEKKYQAKNFQVISISIDKDKDAWQKAIVKDNLTWDNLWDTNSTLVTGLGIQAIPFNYLLDTNGNILAVNQSFEEIDKILYEKLK